jgi:DNA-binding XRE family transcriptional regulator
MKKMWDRPAMRIVSARYSRRGGVLDITFQNGDHFRIAAETVLAPRRPSSSPGANGAASPKPDWTKLRIGETNDVLELAVRGGVIEIPWDRIRSIADPRYRSHLRRQASLHARRIGRRIRSFRLKAGLTPTELAKKIGLARDTLAAIEAGKLESRSELLERVAGALGRRLRDFAKP